MNKNTHQFFLSSSSAPCVHWRYWRFDPGEKLSWKGPLVIVGAYQPTLRKKLENWMWLRMKPVYFKALNNQKILRKTQKGNNLPKRIIKMKYKLMGRPTFTCNLPGGAILPSSPVSYATVCVTLKSHTSVWCVTVCHSSKNIFVPLQSSIPVSTRGLLRANTPKQNFKPLQ